VVYDPNDPEFQGSMFPQPKPLINAKPAIAGLGTQPPTMQPQPMPQTYAQPGINIAPPAPSITPPATSSVSGTTPFSGSSNLIGQQVTPQANPMTNRLLSGAESAISGVGGPAADTASLRGTYASGLSGLNAAPDRKALALDALKTFDEQQADTEKLGIRDIGRNAAAAGRLGSGVVSTQLGDLQSTLARDRNQMERSLAGDVASQSLNDRLATLGAQGQGLGQLSGLDSANASFGINKGNALAGLAGQTFGNDLTNRNEIRNEREYQSGLEQKGIDNAFRQYEVEQGSLNDQFGREYDITRLMTMLGMDSPNALYGDVANTYAGQGADLQSGAGDLLKLLFQNQQREGTI
jgi:hypothetical protein